MKKDFGFYFAIWPADPTTTPIFRLHQARLFLIYMFGHPVLISSSQVTGLALVVSMFLLAEMLAVVVAKPNLLVPPLLMPLLLLPMLHLLVDQVSCSFSSF